jgi:hypothetical protein
MAVGSTARFVGRLAMRELIDRNLDQAMAGFPRLIIIEAIGVGKTATADWALVRCQSWRDRGARLLRGGSVVPLRVRTDVQAARPARRRERQARRGARGRSSTC